MVRRNSGLSLLSVTLAFLSSGCEHAEESHYKSVSNPPTVRVVQPQVRNLVRTVGQPSFIESYERTSVYPKLSGFIEKWNVDIGDKVKKGQELAKLFIPELVEDFGTKKATVKLDEEKVRLALELVEVADANVKAADASLLEAKSILAKYQSEVDRWQTEVERLKKEVARGVVDPQILLESTNQLRSDTASREAAKASIAKAEADLLSRKAMLAKAKVDVSVAKADLAVASSDAKRLEALVGYITLPAPFDGVIVARNANTFDFVTPSTGDPTADPRAPHLSPSGMAAPIYVVDRTDIVRVFIDIPEQDANYVNIGTKASVLVRAFRDQPIPGSVTRTSWALNVKSRTLRAEVDLPNTDSQLLPGMYAYAKVIIDRPNVRVLPSSAFVYNGDRIYCWEYRDGHAVRMEARTGVTDGDWIEVTNLQRASESTNSGESWKPIDGSEKVILGDLTTLADGEKVSVEAEKSETKVTSNTPAESKAAAKAESKAPEPVQ